jgi:N,N'-diacetyllegionaminate synthase
MKHVVIIAEAGVNHNGDAAMAKKLIEAAAAAGADYVKFQTFKAEALVTADAEKAGYQKSTTDPQESQLEMIKKLELSEDLHYELIEHSKKNGIGFLTTAFDPGSLEFVRSLGLNYVKVPSGEITNKPFLKAVASFGVPVILSTGMADVREIRDAIDVLTASGVSKEHLTVLQCTTEYPAPADEINLMAMHTIAQTFGVKIGLSDHSEGIAAAVAAVALGATVIEKHFTLDRSLPGPDHKASLEPAQLKDMVAAIRFTERALGSGVKTAGKSEILNKAIARKSLHAAKAMAKGHIMNEVDFVCMRPGDGISPMRIDEFVGRTLSVDVRVNHKFSPEDFA